MSSKTFYCLHSSRHFLRRLARIAVAFLAAPGWLPLVSFAQVKSAPSQTLPIQDISEAPAPSSVGLMFVPTLEEHPLQAGDEAARFVLGERIEGQMGEEVNVIGQGEVRTATTVIKGDKLRYVTETDQAYASGNVLLMHNGNVFRGTQAFLKVTANEGYLLSPTYHLNAAGAVGNAKRIDLLDPERVHVEQGTYTTCQCAADPAWYFKASSFTLDTGNNIGVARNSVLYFQGVPLLASPYISFPLSNERKSGLLPPPFAFSSTTGFSFTLPYYLNLAPNYDLTFYPRFIPQRGVQLGVEYRYLTPTYAGNIFLEGLAQDRITKTNRYAIHLQHNQILGAGLGAYLNYHRVSDQNYPRDIMSDNLFLGGVQLLFQQEAGVTYQQGPWSALARVQRWQTLYPSAAPYGREPQLNIKYRQYDTANFDLGAEADYSYFRIATKDATTKNAREGQRLMLNPTLSYPVLAPSYFFVPKLRYHLAAYKLDPVPDAIPFKQRDFTISIPTVSLDGGLVFERAMNVFGKPYIQTLEPRLYYVYTPYRQQNFVPLFDAAESDFSLAEIYTENTFVGNDRIADANRLTTGLTTRFIDAASGSEIARFVIAQQYYFRQQQVVFKSDSPISRANHSDWLAGALFRFGYGFLSETAVQYNPTNKQLIRSNLGLSWNPAERKALNLSYRYTRPNATLSNRPIRQFIVSTQWPLTQRLYGVSRINYDIDGHRLTDGLVGFQYNEDCWSFGLAFQRYANGANVITDAPQAGTRVLAQLELKGVAKADNGLLEQFRASVPGYTPMPAMQPPSRFNNYD